MGLLLVSLTQIQEASSKNIIFLFGPLGAGKSTFCQQAAIQSLAVDRPIIFVITEYGPYDAERALKEQHVKETRCIAMGDPYCEWQFK